MIHADQFITRVQESGFGLFSGVPCSFLTPLINHVINDRSLRYVPASNEGDAVAAAVGSFLGGTPGVAMMQNSGLGNAVSPLTSLAWVFRIPVLVIVTFRGDPDLHDEPQHELMGQITGSLLDTMHIPWSWFPSEADQIQPTVAQAIDTMRRTDRPIALVMKKGSVAPTDLIQDRSTRQARQPGSVNERWTGRPGRPTRVQALARVIERTPPTGNCVVIATTGYTGRQLYAMSDHPNHLYMVGSMGCASSLGLGLALARPDLRVVVVDGDGAALMRLGNLPTIGACAPANFIHVLLDNGVHESTGGQATVSEAISLGAIAAASGYATVLAGDDPGLIDDLFDAADQPAPPTPPGPRFVHLKTRPGVPSGLPRPSITPVQVARRLMEHVGAGRPLSGGATASGAGQAPVPT